MTTGFFATITWASFLFIILFYVCYFILLFYFSGKGRSLGKTPNYIYPTISLIVPVYNEEKIIAKKIKNIEELDYPPEKMDVIFVDGHSTDSTSEIISTKAQSCRKSIRLIRQDKREGYTRAVVEGIRCSAGEIIVATDAASYHYPDAIKELVKHFSNRKIGAVTGQEIVLGDTRQLGPQLEKSYRFFYDFMRKAETEMDSTPDSKGEILAVRRDICYELLPTLELSSNASFDSCVPYQAKLMGYRTIYDEGAKYYEYAPASFSDRMRVQIRRATVLIGAMFLFKHMLLRKRYNKFGLLIFPAHFVLTCVLPSLFVLGIAALLFSTIITPLGVLPLWIIVALAVLLSSKSRWVLISFVQSQFALFLALFRLARRRDSLLIDSVPSTRMQTK